MSGLKSVTLRRLLIAGLVVVACCCALVLWPVCVASSLRSELRRMHAGPLPIEQLRIWAGQHGERVTCSAGRCEASVVVNNRFLWRLHLAPGTNFIATVVEEDGQLVETHLWLTDISYIGRRPGSRTLLIVDYGGSRTHGTGLSVPHVRSGLRTVTYGIPSTAAPGDLALAFEVNVWCLARIGGCEGEQQAPRVWALRKQQLERWERQPHTGPDEDE